MPPPVDPVTSPVTFPFENGAIKLVTVIDPVSGCHTVVCDLCDKSIPLGIQAASKPLFNHRKDLVGVLVRSGHRICLAVLEVTAFQFGTSKITKSMAFMDDLEDKDKHSYWSDN